MDRPIFRQLSPENVHDMTDEELEIVADFSNSVIDYTRGNRIIDLMDGLVSAAGTAAGRLAKVGKVVKQGTEAADTLNTIGLLSDVYAVTSFADKIGRFLQDRLDQKHAEKMEEAVRLEQQFRERFPDFVNIEDDDLNLGWSRFFNEIDLEFLDNPALQFVDRSSTVPLDLGASKQPSFFDALKSTVSGFAETIASGLKAAANGFASFLDRTFGSAKESVPLSLAERAAFGDENAQKTADPADVVSAFESGVLRSGLINGSADSGYVRESLMSEYGYDDVEAQRAINEQRGYSVRSPSELEAYSRMSRAEQRKADQEGWGSTASSGGNGEHSSNAPTESKRPQARPEQSNDSKSDGGKPVLLDLDDDGIEITELSKSTQFFDTGGDGLLHRTAWAMGAAARVAEATTVEPVKAVATGLRAGFR